MAKFLKVSQTQPMKYMFEITLHKVELHVPYEVKVIVVMKRGSRRLQSAKDVSIGTGHPVADFGDEKMTMMTTVYKDKATKKMQDRVVSTILISTHLLILLRREISSCKS